MKIARALIVAATLLAPIACAQPVAVKGADDRERQAVAPLKNRYKDVVMGTDVKGANLYVYVDVNNLYSMDQSDEDALKADALRRWVRAWKANHSHHGRIKLRVSFRDYYGRELLAETTEV